MDWQLGDITVSDADASYGQFRETTTEVGQFDCSLSPFGTNFVAATLIGLEQQAITPEV